MIADNADVGSFTLAILDGKIEPCRVICVGDKMTSVQLMDTKETIKIIANDCLFSDMTDAEKYKRSLVASVKK